LLVISVSLFAIEGAKIPQKNKTKVVDENGKPS
jgi:hypothetical protein